MPLSIWPATNFDVVNVEILDKSRDGAPQDCPHQKTHTPIPPSPVQLILYPDRNSLERTTSNQYEFFPPAGPYGRGTVGYSEDPCVP